MEKHKCDCGKEAKYCYLPGFADSNNDYVCEDCVVSSDDTGCSCNWRFKRAEVIDSERTPPFDGPYNDDLPEGEEGKDWRWINKNDGIWINLDDRGRPYPCCEYAYEEEGFEINSEE